MMELLAVTILQSLILIVSAALVVFYLGLTLAHVTFELASRTIHFVNEKQIMVRNWLHSTRDEHDRIKQTGFTTKTLRSTP